MSRRSLDLAEDGEEIYLTPRRERHPQDDEITHEFDDAEERGLLTGQKSKTQASDSILEGLSRRSIVYIALVILVLLSLVISIHPLLSLHDTRTANLEFHPGQLLSNGTHDYENIVLLISIDGLSAQYLERGLTPHLFDISRQGLRAKWMKPAFPTITFPNHWTLITGLHPESHGIIANRFWDPHLQAEFLYTNPAQSWDAHWWGGEPLWATASKAGLKTANLMWPGPPQTMEGKSPTYHVPFQGDVSLGSKLGQILRWIELPLDQRPKLITAYEPSLDQAGHLGGPGSEVVNKSLADVDSFARDLHQAISARNLSHIVDVIFVSDHGMTDTSNVRIVYLDDILGEDGFHAIEHEDGWPSVGLWFQNGTDVERMLMLLQDAAQKQPEAFSVFTPETMPTRFHFANNHRIAPIYVVPHVGWAITNQNEHKVIMQGDYNPKGNHGYDNNDPSMFATFIADGPFSTHLKWRHQRRTQDTNIWKRIFSTTRTRRGWLSGGWNEMYVMEGFDNTEIYGLVTKLLGIEGHSAPTNGTAGFWDRYF